MQRTYPRPNGLMVTIHVGEDADFGEPDKGFKRSAKGPGWAVDEEMPVNQPPANPKTTVEPQLIKPLKK